MITEQGIEAAISTYHENLRNPKRPRDGMHIKAYSSMMERDAMKAAIEAYEKSKWRPIEEASSLDRIFVSGWQKRSGSVAGYWWVHEDVTDENGKPMDHPDATYFQPLPTPPQGDEG